MVSTTEIMKISATLHRPLRILYWSITCVLTVRFMKFKNFFSISVMTEKSPFGKFSLTVVTFI